ncbi:MAG: transglycosylase domain-containing protein [Luteolibacter sp.]
MPRKSTNSRRNSSRNRRGAAPRSRRPGFFTLLFFWPFYLVNGITRGLSWLIRWSVRLVAYPAVLGLAAAAVLAVIYGWKAQSYDLTRIREMPERSIVYDRLGNEIGRIHGERRSIVPLSQVSPEFRKAILAREDARFYYHFGFDPIGMGRAAMRNVKGKREGASTITQQLASDIFGLKVGEKRGDLPRQLHRKCLEIAIAFRLESAFTKDEILEAYINQINWGRQIKGIGEASRIYFEKHPVELTLSDSALLAGIVRGPDAFNPFSSMEAATRERNTTLDRMVDAKVITREEADAAKAETIDVRPVWRRTADESYAMDAIRRDLELILEDENIQLGGLEITTTIDLRLQKIGEESLDRKLREIERRGGYGHQTRAAWRNLPEDGRREPQYIQGAAVVIENRTGAVLAVIGGRDANESKYNRAIQARRQIGSVFKPFVYMAAFDHGMRPETLVSDGPIQRGEIRGAPTWRPNNADGKFGGMLPASNGLIRSRNTMSVRVGNHAGLGKVKEVAQLAGFGRDVPETPASFLGSWEATPWAVASAYTIFPNNGVRFRPFLISEIKDRDGNVLYSSPPLSYHAATAGSAYSVSKILDEVTTRGTGASVARMGFDKPSAGKTGTTNDFKDAWFAGYTSSVTCAVWVGFDRPKRTFHGGYGSVLSLPVWVDIMKAADRLDYKAGDLHGNVAMVDCRLCRLSGKRATSGCETHGSAYNTQVPRDIALPANDLCPIHPARALPVGDPSDSPAPPRARPVGETAPAMPPPPRARPAEEPPPPRARPAEEPPPRAAPVEAPPLRARPVDPDPPRARPVE